VTKRADERTSTRHAQRIVERHHRMQLLTPYCLTDQYKQGSVLLLLLLHWTCAPARCHRSTCVYTGLGPTVHLPVARTGTVATWYTGRIILAVHFNSITVYSRGTYCTTDRSVVQYRRHTVIVRIEHTPRSKQRRAELAVARASVWTNERNTLILQQACTDHVNTDETQRRKFT
jgi:hypothetical protein